MRGDATARMIPSNREGESVVNRRELLGFGLQAAAFAGAGRALLSDARADGSERYAAAFERLDRYVVQYLADMNAPGLTLVLADSTGVLRTCAYGVDDLATRAALDVNDLFHIGSITKSFLGLCLVQLQEEGRLDLHRPVLDYLPGLRLDGLTRPLAAHDLLTHSAGLPDGELFPADPAFRHRATAAPGTLFHYSNMAYEALGLLLARLDGRSLAESFRARLLAPLGMHATEPVITFDALDRYARSYAPALNDRPFPRLGPLSVSRPIYVTGASGSIASTAGDMGRYLLMLIRHGAAPKGRVVSEAGFELFAHPHMPAGHFGPGTSYGYGIAVDTLDGHARLRHTGGMVSFASALDVDRDARIGVFASINAMQGYRPRPVTEYALRLLRASGEGRPLPELPPRAPALQVDGAADYAGRYVAPDGRSMRVVAEGDRLHLDHPGGRVALEPWAGTEHAFIVPQGELGIFPLVFSRPGGESGRFQALGWGRDWYAGEHASPGSLPQMTVPDAWRAFEGHYRSEDPWFGSLRVVFRAGQLWVDGVVPLEPAADGRFFLRDEPLSPEWVAFTDVVGGQARRLCLSGFEFRRVD